MTTTTFTQHRQIGVCKVCRMPIDGVDEWWHTNGYPATGDLHYPVYLEGQRTTPAEAMVLLTAWLSWHGYVLSCHVRTEGGTIVPDEEDVAPFTYRSDAYYASGPILHTWTAIPADVWHETYHIEGES